ncbi:hypothetical protein [Butyricicoccus porcorum]|uniref:hypothetical protein n=1 Tax=Butyricicoccus porcorum TaxID=1945634 RepID=UPI003F4AEB90
MRLLYAEDERGMSEAVVDILTYHNYIVDAVYDGEEALAFAQTQQYAGYHDVKNRWTGSAEASAGRWMQYADFAPDSKIAD